MSRYVYGDVVLYKNPEFGGISLMEITSKKFKRAKGDILPHFYYHGNLFPLKFNDSTEKFELEDKYQKTYATDVNEKHLSNLNSLELDLSEGILTCLI